MPASSTSSPPRSGAALRRTRPVLFRRANAALPSAASSSSCSSTLRAMWCSCRRWRRTAGNHVFSEAHPSGRARRCEGKGCGAAAAAAFLPLPQGLRGGSGGGGGGGGGSTGWDGGRGTWSRFGRGQRSLALALGRGSVMATADEEVNHGLRRRLRSDRWTSSVGGVRQVVPQGGGGGVGRLLEVGPPPPSACSSPGDTDLLESHSCSSNERVHTLGSSSRLLYADESYRGRLLQRS